MNEKLPKILAVLACDDHGACDPEPTAVCPHCGADGRYVYTFLCDDGTTRGAMKGCIKLFPRSPAAGQCEKALAKQSLASRGKGYASKWDERILTAIDQLRAGTLEIRTLEAICEGIVREKKAWMRSKGYIR